ncbi:telomere repeat-binding protein 3 isoform X2 [Sesamum indicum]|uniref:Telomere repeat-binding protein 3 isoform X2 n=1 Tax=Sesamum indicum TaxID=4182 RepID=A0A8M8UXY6_SESIN|nr:telomere repeat-binding protein 3 isoform X2 [Sesamum indicum]
MVSKKRLDCRFNGYRAPIVPRAPRSIRRRGPRKKLVEDSKLCAFELLAAVAGKLLEESESSASSNIAEGKVKVGACLDGDEKVQPKDDTALKSESLDRGSSAESAFVPEICVQEHKLLSNFKALPQAENDYVVDHISVHASPDRVKKIDCDIKLGICEEKNSDGNTTCKIGGSACFDDSFNHKVESEPEVQPEDEKNQIGDLSMANRSTVKDSIGECVNNDVLNNSESSVQLPLYREPVAGAFFQKHWNDVKLGIRDDDENSFGCNKSRTRIRPFRPQPRIGHRRIRKLMTSKYWNWKGAPKLKDCELYNTSEGMKSFYRYRKNVYARERSQRVPLKKRKLSDHSFAVSYDQDVSSDSISNLPEKGVMGDKGNLAMVLHRDNGVSATVRGHPKPKDPHVKLSIKSFKVPELYIEVPETATVGSLKRTVMEAVTTILGAGIRVGVVFQGKKVRDDSRTLQQAGISQCSNLDNLGFTLEPSFTRVSPSLTPKKLPALSSCDADRTLPRSPATPMMASGISNTSVDTPVLAKLDDVGQNKYICSTKTPSDALLDGAVPDSKALVPVPPVNVEELAVVPANLKPKRSELSQRRTRRPFSVAEVEALVEAVEKLGTGRWRDVKMLAFENADHRTYVDLKVRNISWINGRP